MNRFGSPEDLSTQSSGLKGSITIALEGGRTAVHRAGLQARALLKKWTLTRELGAAHKELPYTDSSIVGAVARLSRATDPADRARRWHDVDDSFLMMTRRQATIANNTKLLRRLRTRQDFRNGKN